MKVRKLIQKNLCFILINFIYCEGGDTNWCVGFDFAQPDKLYKKNLLYSRAGFNIILRLKNYHLIIALPQVNPLPKAAKTTVSPVLIFPCSQASVNAIGIEAAVVLPYFWMLLYT